MHVKTSLCVAMQLFLPLFGMAPSHWRPRCLFTARPLSFAALSTCVEDGRMENCMSALHGAAQMRFPTAVRTTE